MRKFEFVTKKIPFDPTKEIRRNSYNSTIWNVLEQKALAQRVGNYFSRQNFYKGDDLGF